MADVLRRSFLGTGAAVVCLAGNAVAQTAHTRADASQLVNRAAAFLQSNPRSVALATFNDPKGAFRDGDLYLYALDATDPGLTMLAHGANRGLVGLSQIDIVDAEGKAFNSETVALVKAQGEGWVTYKWPNPITKKIAQKSSFVKLVDGVIIGAGIYE